MIGTKRARKNWFVIVPVALALAAIVSLIMAVQPASTVSVETKPGTVIEVRFIGPHGTDTIKSIKQVKFEHRSGIKTAVTLVGQMYNDKPVLLKYIDEEKSAHVTHKFHGLEVRVLDADGGTLRTYNFVNCHYISYGVDNYNKREFILPNEPQIAEEITLQCGLSKLTNMT